MIHRAAVVVVFALGMAACSSEAKSVSAPDTEAPTTTASSTTTVATGDTAATTTEQAPITEPPTTEPATSTTLARRIPSAPAVKEGHVYLDSSVVLPAGFTQTGGASTDGTTTYVPGYTGDTSNGSALPAVAESTDRVNWQMSAPSIDGYHHPPGGFTINDTGFSLTSVAAGPVGIVAVGVAGWWRAPRRDVYARVDLAWFSADGQNWQVIDFRPVVGGADNDLIALDNAQWLDGKFFVTGADGPFNDLAGPAKGLILESGDGVNWTQLAEPATPWAAGLDQVMGLNGTLLASGVEYVCTTDATSITLFSVGAQPRLWSSTDDGQSWVQVPIPAGAVGGDKPAPVDASGCPATDPGSLESMDALETAFAQKIAGVGVVDGAVVVWSTDEATAYVTTDLVTWAAEPIG